MWIGKQRYKDILDRISTLEKNQELFRETVKKLFEEEEALADSLKEQIQELPALFAKELTNNRIDK